MMTFGICGMIGELIVKLIRGNIDAFDWMMFAIWAVVAICGAIRKGRKRKHHKSPKGVL